MTCRASRSPAPPGWIASASTSSPRSPTAPPRKMPGSCSRTCWRIRFKLKLHKESKEAAIYELVVAKGGIKMKEAAQTAAAPAEARGRPSARTSEGKDGILRTPHGQLGIQAYGQRPHAHAGRCRDHGSSDRHSRNGAGPPGHR